MNRRATPNRLKLKILAFLVFLSFPQFSLAAEDNSPWMNGITRKDPTPLRLTPTQKSPIIGQSPGSTRVWVTKKSKNGFLAVLLGKPVQGQKFAWLPETAVSASPRRPASSKNEPQVTATTNTAPPYNGPRWRAQLLVGGSGAFNYSYTTNSGGSRTTGTNTYGISASPLISYLFGKNPRISGLDLTLRAQFTYIFGSSTYTFPLIWSTQLQAEYLNRTSFSPYVFVNYESLPLPYPLGSNAGSPTGYATLSTQIIWAGAGVHTHFPLLRQSANFFLDGAYSLLASSTLASSSTALNSQGWKITSRLGIPLVSHVSLGIQAQYLRTNGSITLSGYELSTGLGLSI